MSSTQRLLRLPLASLAVALVLAACSPTEQASPTSTDAQATSGSEAPTNAEASEDVKPFAIGTLQAFALRDGALEFPNDNQVFGLGRTPQEVAAVLAAAGVATDKVQLSLQTLLVKAGDRVLLFDTGAASNFGPTTGKLAASLATGGIDPASVTDVFISHAHGDHIGGLLDTNGAAAFPNATVHMAASEWAFLSGMDAEKAKGFGVGRHAELIAAITPKLNAFEAGSELLPSLVSSSDIQGHTPGHSGYVVGTGSDSLLYVGDAAHSSIISVQKPEWNIAFDGGGDPAKAVASRKALFEANAASGQRIFAAHFPYPGLGKFEQSGEGYVWVAE